MTMTIYLDTVTGAVMTSRIVLGIALAGAVILIEALILYRFGWAEDSTTSSDDKSQTVVAAHPTRKQFMTCLRDSFVANLASTVVGWFLSQYLFFYDFWSISFWVTAFVITVVVETLMLLALRRKPVGRSLAASLAMNASSYLVLIILFGLIYLSGLAAEI